MSKTNGKFIVIDGADGSGKSTQIKLLIRRLKKSGRKVKLIDFPQYHQKSAGMVEEYLSGKYGKADEVDPKIASLFYAVDRFDASFKLRKWLKDGYVVLADRYVASNMAHQGSKIASQKARKEFYNWLFETEFKILNIPKPDISLILHVDSRVSQSLIKKRGEEAWKGIKRDIHETNKKHLQKAEQIYLEISNSIPHIARIECMERGKIMSINEIHNKIWEKVKKII